jgi:hypothetical protein
MAGSIGYSFAPSFDNADMGRRGASPAAAPQGALKTLNFRLPRVAGAATSNAISPLVTDERRGSPLAEAVLQSVMRTVLGPEQAAAFTMAPPVTSPSPVRQPMRDPGSALFAQMGMPPSSAPPRQQMTGPTPQPMPRPTPPPPTPLPGVRPGQTPPAPMPPPPMGAQPGAGGTARAQQPEFDDFQDMRTQFRNRWRGIP